MAGSDDQGAGPHVLVVVGQDSESECFPPDPVNSPYARKRAILSCLEATREFELRPVEGREPDLSLALLAHDPRFVAYLASAWERWVELGDRRCADFCYQTAARRDGDVPPLVPANGTFRDAMQEPGASVLAQACYYHVDRFTPIFHGLLEALRSDLAVVRAAADAVPFPPRAAAPGDGPPPAAVYALVTHPGHHATALSVGGFCYLNSAAILARLLQEKARAARGAGGADGSHGSHAACRVAVLDVDYHFGNGTASILYADPSVLVASLHADPETEYPFNCGHTHQTGAGAGAGATLCVPLGPNTTWERAGAGGAESYSAALRRALAAVASHGAEALIVSLGVDTYARDPVHLPGAGVKLEPADFEKLGALIGEGAQGVPTYLVQEGGYELDVVGFAVRDVLRGLMRGRGSHSASSDATTQLPAAE